MNHGVPSILVVDDEIDICKNMEDIFTDMGYRVGIATNGLAALELLRKDPYDLALLDLKMPGMDGLTLYREIKKLRSGTAAFLVTAFASTAASDDATAIGILQILPKPVDFSKLLGLVDRTLSQPLVLIVDDDQDLCQNLWDLIHQHSYRVCITHDEEQAAELLEEMAFDVVLIDMKLPKGDGRHIFRLVKAASPKAGTIAITGCRIETDHLIQQVMAEGADAVCYKPFDIPELLRTIERLSDRQKHPV